MDKNTLEARIAVAACLLALASVSGFAAAQSTSDRPGSATPGAAGPADKQEAAAMKHVEDAAMVVRRMESEPRMKELLQQAKGIFIAPTYGRAALGVGASGGAGVLLVKRDNGTWSDPAFYNIGGINLGAQIGAEGGAIAMVLNNEKAVDRFMQRNNFSLSADAGLTVVNWARIAQGSAGTGDVVAWAGTKGLFGNVATIGVNDIRFNQNLTNAYYHQTVAVKDVIDGKFKNPQSKTLKQALAATSGGASASGSSGGGSESTGKSGSNR